MSKQDGTGRQVTTEPFDDPRASIMHIDMDAFFASVELLDRPDLRGRPVIVGHHGARSVVTAATYEARRYGVNSAMPMAVALRRCPQAVVLEPHMERYREASRRVMAIFDSFTPLVERLSIDEAFLDVAGARRISGSPFAIGTEIRRRVHAELGLTCSVGIASTKFVAKLASGRSKPDGLLVVPADGVREFLDPLPVSALWGVGASTEEALLRRGLRTVADVATTPLPSLVSALGEATGRRLHALANGVDPRPVDTRQIEKSAGHEITFADDVADPELVRRELLRLCDKVAVRMRRSGVRCRTVAVKVRFGDFSTLTRSRTLVEATDVARVLYEASSALLEAANPMRRPVRLIGVRGEQLVEGDDVAFSLWSDSDDWRDAELAVDGVAARFGSGAVRPASLLSRSAPESAKGIDLSDTLATRNRSSD
ncbi:MULTISPECIES: DNA polymerase IV [unclassified Rathayibacter]|uniref:DNA polymerase IV n=1 Tax=unclassified Rathayibacter TaxID=2609250 RepID=UPI000CE7DB32|nr:MULTISPECIES: DNA polymerase IV [unclassified Rathayibacter]PPF20647.1 DNA polymerase IV [Rathayibacter sp. AY1A7]PPF71233.1 DNA polymerase IV [Rathayibacter sp. AY1E6]PPG07820.1 DNA polymerase IV [Rathayibacter sp. AY2B1]PPG30183.1 DNA polymerase IV [Rathayibacter sp. AY2B9]PPG58379.1 DNA polymerase IV [Rathayibacter sp. AY2B7]